jgi:hypothetical protein
LVFRFHPGGTLILTFSLREKELTLNRGGFDTRGSLAWEVDFLSLRERTKVRVNRIGPRCHQRHRDNVGSAALN